MDNLKKIFKLTGALGIALVLALSLPAAGYSGGKNYLSKKWISDPFKVKKYGPINDPFKKDWNKKFIQHKKYEIGYPGIGNVHFENMTVIELYTEKEKAKAQKIVLESGVSFKEAIVQARMEIRAEEEEIQARKDEELREQIQREGFSEKKISEMVGEEWPSYEQKKDALIKLREKRKEQFSEAKVVSKQKIIAPLSTRPLRKNGQRVIALPGLGD
jgi:hypothetical protein